MSSVFTPRANFVARASIVAVVVALVGTIAFILGFVRSSFYTGVGVEMPQPVPFSHQHHVAGLGIDCRYCHTTAEDSAFAGMPATQTCMNCHGDLWTDALRWPHRHVRWILIEERAEGGDVLAQLARQDETFLAGFERVTEHGGLALYRRR